MTGEPYLFQADWQGMPVSIARASEDELAALAAPVSTDSISDVFDPWSIIAIRSLPTGSTSLRGLGWRAHMQNTWITSRLVAVDPTRNLIGTRSGHIYLLGGSDKPEITTGLREHLAYALRTWGFTDVR